MVYAFLCLRLLPGNFSLPLVKSPIPISSGLLLVVSLTSLIPAGDKIQSRQYERFTSVDAEVSQFTPLAYVPAFTALSLWTSTGTKIHPV